MKKIILCSIISFLALFITCTICKKINNAGDEEKYTILKSKGFMENEKRLEPVILSSDEELFALRSINMKNTIAAVNKKGEFCLLEIDNDGDAAVEPIVPGFPHGLSPGLGDDYYTDVKNNVMWVAYGMAIYVLDIKSEKTGESGIIGDMINPVFMVNPQDVSIFTEVGSLNEDEPCFFVLFNLSKNEIIYKRYCPLGVFYPYKNELLFCEILDNKYKWQMRDYKFNKIKKNELTKKLTDFQMDVDSTIRNYNMDKRMMIGIPVKDIPDQSSSYYLIRWDENFKNVKIEPFFNSYPAGIDSINSFIFSPDGNWASLRGSNMTGDDELIFYHIDDKYPQGVSTAIRGGKTSKQNIGDFFNHEKWGTCFLEKDTMFPDKLFVYRLSDSLKEEKKEFSYRVVPLR